jgi:hypothetical protein
LDRHHRDHRLGRLELEHPGTAAASARYRGAAFRARGSGAEHSCTYLGVTSAGLIGGLGVQTVGGHYLGYIGATFVVVAIVIAELATSRINVANAAHRAAGVPGDLAEPLWQGEREPLAQGRQSARF